MPTTYYSFLNRLNIPHSYHVFQSAQENLEEKQNTLLKIMPIIHVYVINKKEPFAVLVNQNPPKVHKLVLHEYACGL